MKKIITPSSKFFLSTCIVLYTCFSFSQPVTFNYTGTVQTYTVPACTYTITVDAKGAEGSAASSGGPSIGGKGGRVQATFSVTPGEVLNIYVGQKAPSGIGGWNGGGNGGISNSNGGGGGGASDIRRGGNAFSNRIIVGAGGGGGGWQISSNQPGGNGGGLSGNNGLTAPYGGGGGTQISGGNGGSGSPIGNNGVIGIGGDGVTNSTYGINSGGGGGGYYGGGSGGAPAAYGGGGGGGSSYAISTATGVTHTQGFQTGDGQIIITPAAASGPTAPGTITGAATVCAGSSEAYSVSTVPTATSYSWTIPAGAAISGQGTTSVTVTFGTASGNISVTASNSCGTSTASAKAITAEPNPTANAGNDITICSGSSATLTATGGAIYLWSTGETDAVIVVSPVSGTTYSVTVTNAGGCSDSASVMVTVNPALAASVTTNPPTCGNNDGSASVTPSGGAGNYTFLWSNGNTTSTVTGLTGQPTDTLFVTITDANGCTITDTAIVECVTGIAHSSGSLSIRVSPNPSNGQFTIYNLENKTCDLNIYGMMGEKIYFDKIENRTSYVVHYDFADGMYFLSINTDSGSIMRKIVINKQ